MMLVPEEKFDELVGKEDSALKVREIEVPGQMLLAFQSAENRMTVFYVEK